ncbi:MAG: ATP-binding protein [Opitutaceae bacterium]|nr:ATP-binding protein [Opitutaceae bacterium]
MIFKRNHKRFDENPLINRINTVLEDIESLLEKLEFLPPVPTEEDRQRDPATRLMALGEIPRLHVALGRDLELAVRLAEMVREGYVDRAPNAKYWEQHQHDIEEFIRAIKTGTSTEVADRCVGLIGVSGVGKSRTLQKLLSLLPQVIEHDRTAHPCAPLKQIVWVKVECPHNRSPGSIAREIIHQLGVLVGEDYDSVHGVGNNDDVITNAATLVRLHCVGVLIVDEIQNAISKMVEPRKDLINMLVELSNKLRLPILFVGTPKANRLLGREMRSGRRLTGINWDRLSATDEEWIELVNTVWDYQWNANFTELDDALRAKLYKLTQGVPAFLVRLFHFTQMRAILGGKSREDEKLTPEAFDATFEVSFTSVKPLIRALESGDKVLLDRYEDLPRDFDLEEMFAAEAERLQKEQTGLLVSQIMRARKNASKAARRKMTQLALLMARTPDRGVAKEMEKVVRKALDDGKDPIKALVEAGFIKDTPEGENGAGNVSSSAA